MVAQRARRRAQKEGRSGPREEGLGDRGSFDMFADRTTYQGEQTVKNEWKVNGMAWETKELRAVALVRAQLF